MKDILRPSKVKIILNAIISVCFVSAMIFLPAFGISGTFSSFTFGHKISSFLLSWVISFIIYFPLAFSLVYLVSSVKNSTIKAKEIILALILIAVFNPLTISLLVSKVLFRSSALPASIMTPKNNAVESNIPPEAICGLRIIEIMANSKVKDAGIENGEVILKINGAEIKSVQDIFVQIDKKRPGDKASIETDQGLKTAELARDLNDPNRPVLGVKLEPNLCR